MQNTIAGQWIREDFEEGMRWYAEEIPRDFTNPKEVKNVASVLMTVPSAERFLVVDWLERQEGAPGWSDTLVMTLGKSQVLSEPDETTQRLVGLISNEADRFELVTQFVGGTSASSIKKLRHSPNVLNRLVEAARLTEANAAQLKDTIAASKWSGS